MLKINDKEIQLSKKEVEIEIRDRDRKPEDSNNKFKMVDAIEYKFSVETNTDDDKKYFKDMLDKEMQDCGNFALTSLVYSLEGEEWYLDSYTKDKRFNLLIKHNIKPDFMSIDCEYLEYGLLSAYLIAVDLNKEE